MANAIKQKLRNGGKDNNKENYLFFCPVLFGIILRKSVKPIQFIKQFLIKPLSTLLGSSLFFSIIYFLSIINIVIKYLKLYLNQNQKTE